MSAVLADAPRFLPMQEADVDEVVAAEVTLYEFPWSRLNFSDSLAAGYSAWVTRQGPALIAYAVMMLSLDEAHLLNLSVLRPWQRRGHGAALLRHLFAVARGAGALQMFLEVRPSNFAGLALYNLYGFNAVGVRRGYYPARVGREDGIVMRAAL